jgi:hypothetical protein
MKRSHLIGALSAAMLVFITLSANAALLGRLETSPGSGTYHAYYDNQLDITWMADANINGLDTWDNQVAWAAGLTVGGVGNWRLPDMDKNGDDTIVDCLSGTQAACMDNEYGHLFLYGEGTILGNGIASNGYNPFSNVQDDIYWSGTESEEWEAYNRFVAFVYILPEGFQSSTDKYNSLYAWAVHDGDVGAAVVPIPAAAWLFGSGLICLMGFSRRTKAS